MTPAEPCLAHCATGPGRDIDIDMVRLTVSAAQFSASAILGKPWPALAAAGWSVIPVRIVPDDGAAAAPAVRRPAPRPRKPPCIEHEPAPAPAPASHGRVQQDRMRLVRMGQRDPA